MPKQSQLVCQYLENISRDVLNNYQDIIRSYVAKRQGIYALYSKEKLYYVGLATNLRTRLRQHLADRHGESWERFSVYLTVDSSHMKELETLFLRLSMPKGNKIKGKFRKAENLRRKLTSDIKSHQVDELYSLIGKKSSEKTTERKVLKKNKGQGTSKDVVLSEYVDSTLKLRASYKGETKKAWVHSGGKIFFERKTYNTPTAAAKAATKRPTINGWTFWRFRNSAGKWVKLRELKSKPLKIKRTVSKKIRIEKKPSLAGYFNNSVMLKRTYKGKEFIAWVIKDGRINFGGDLYNSPTMAGIAAIGRTVNGWKFWKYKNKNGEWVKLDELRR